MSTTKKNTKRAASKKNEESIAKLAYDTVALRAETAYLKGKTYCLEHPRKVAGGIVAAAGAAALAVVIEVA